MRRLAALSLLAVLPLAACGGGSASSSAAAGSSPSAAASSSPSGSAGALPTVQGSYGDKPTLTFPDSPPPDGLRKVVLKEGTGPAVAKGDLLVADYLGQVWKGKVFDNSYDRGQVAAFPIGVGKVIPGWDSTLVGVKAGSRVLLSIPPAEGYGTSGNTSAGIGGTDTLEFVVDVVTGIGPNAAGDPKAAKQKVDTSPVTVKGALGSRPTITVAAKAAQPNKQVTTVLAKGSGAAVTDGTVVVQYEAVDWSGKDIASTWQDGTPMGVPVGGSAQSSAFDALKGIPLGSRVLLKLPGQQGQSSVALVVDLVAEPGTAKKAAAG